MPARLITTLAKISFQSKLRGCGPPGHRASHDGLLARQHVNTLPSDPTVKWLISESGYKPTTSSNGGDRTFSREEERSMEAPCCPLLPPFSGRRPQRDQGLAGRTGSSGDSTPSVLPRRQELGKEERTMKKGGASLAAFGGGWQQEAG